MAPFKTVLGIPFSTEFPLRKSMGHADFVAEVVAWLRGNSNSSVLDEYSESEIHSDNARLVSEKAEELRFRVLADREVPAALGFRHEIPDNQGRMWRTECVLSEGDQTAGVTLLRLRTQCLARAPGAELIAPMKPYIVKALIGSNWGGLDGRLMVTDRPIWLKDDQECLELARLITCGKASKYLPILYVSSINVKTWLISEEEIEKLAYDLGGVAHVVVEPNRNFSFELRDVSAGTNVYGGTVGLSIPSKGIIQRYYLSWMIENSIQLTNVLKSASVQTRSQMPAMAWDWADLQDQALRAQLARERTRLSSEEIESLYQDELGNLHDQIKQLQSQLAALSLKELEGASGLVQDSSTIEGIGPQIYSGETLDRLRFAVTISLRFADQYGLDARTRAVFERFLDKVPLSPALNELKEDLKRATKDPRRMPKAIEALLSRHRYVKKSEKNHTRFDPIDPSSGLEALTVAKTPSDRRGLKNLKAQIENVLGLSKLS